MLRRRRPLRPGLLLALLVAGVGLAGVPRASALVVAPIVKQTECTSGYTRYGPNLCMIPNPINRPNLLTNTTLAGVSDAAADNLVTAQGAGARVAILLVYCQVTDNATADQPRSMLFISTPDGVNTTASTPDVACVAKAPAASTFGEDIGQYLVALDSSGRFEWETAITGAAASVQFLVYQIGYFD